MEKDKKANGGASIVAIALIVVALLLSVYVGGYHWLSEIRDESYSEIVDFDTNRKVHRRDRLRLYKYEWMVMASKPLAKIESALTGRRVTTMTFLTNSTTIRLPRFDFESLD